MRPIGLIVWTGVVIVVLAASGCATPEEPQEPELNETSSAAWACAAPYVVPAYVRPATDVVAFESLIEGAGHLPGPRSNWVDASAGNICGGAEPELLLLKNETGFLSILRGPTPHLYATSEFSTSATDPWRALAVGKLGTTVQEEQVVAIRQVSTTIADLIVARADSASCLLSPTGTSTIGTPSNSDWKDVAIGDFDGNAQNEIALVRSGSPNFVIVNGSTLLPSFSGVLDSNASLPWQRIAAGDLDGDGRAELVAARHVTDGASATVLVYKWNGAGFTRIATSTFGNTGSSDWTGITVGDFNGDGTRSVALVKNSGSNFTLMSLPAGSSQLQVIATDTLDSASGQPWRAVVASDWSSADQGAQELIAVRAAVAPYRTDIFVYGDDYHRVSRDTGLSNVKAQAYYERCAPGQTVCPSWAEVIPNVIASLQDTHTNTYQWLLRDPGDYTGLVQFLEATRNTCVDGQQIRVWVSFFPYGPDSNPPQCALPEDTDITPFRESDYFPGPLTASAATCDNFAAWGDLIGRLALEYPHLVAVGQDDFSWKLDPEDSGSDSPDYPITTSDIAILQANIRRQAKWVSFVPTVYYDWNESFVGQQIADLGRLFDTIMFYFRNEKQGYCEAGCDLGPTPWCPGGCANACLGGACAERTIRNAPSEFCDMRTLVPRGRKLQLGTYFTQHCSCGTPSAEYNYDLSRLVLNRPWLGLMVSPHTRC